jgi:hypothetical protein
MVGIVETNEKIHVGPETIIQAAENLHLENDPSVNSA